LHQPRDRAELLLAGQAIVDGVQLGHDGRVFLLRPGADGLFGVVAEQRVEHGVFPLCPPVLSEDEPVWRQPTARPQKEEKSASRMSVGKRLVRRPARKELTMNTTIKTTTGTDDTFVSGKRIWASRIMGGLPIAFLTFDAAIKLARLAPAVTGTVQL